MCIDGLVLHKLQMVHACKAWALTREQSEYWGPRYPIRVHHPGDDSYKLIANERLGRWVTGFFSLTAMLSHALQETQKREQNRIQVGI